MTETIIAAISAKLRETFGEACAVYTEQPEQGTQGPCFFIALMKSSWEKKNGRRNLRSNHFEIQYMPESMSAFHREADGVAGVLYEKLENLEPDGVPITAAAMSCEKKDGVLHFYAEYKFFFAEQSVDAEAMEELSSQTRLGD